MVAVAFAGAAAIRELVSGDDGSGDAADGARLRIERRGSTRVDGTPPALTHDTPAPATWRIRFRIATPGTEETEVVIVRAPFDSHTDVRVRGESSERRESALGVAATKPAAGPAVVLAPPPEPAGLRTGPAIVDAAAHGLVERREQRRVAGRACQVYRSGSAFGGTTFVPPTSATDYVDACIDEHGLVLEVVEFYEGRIIRHRVATSVELDVKVTDGDLSRLPHQQTLAAIQGGGSVRPIAVTSQPVGQFFVLDAPPDGFSHAGRYEVVPPQPDITNDETRGSVVAATADVYVKGSDALIVERGARLDTAAPWELDDRFPDVDVGGELGTGEFLAGVTGAEIRVRLPGGRFVRVYGTITREELLAVVRALRPTEGGAGHDYLDD